MEQWEKELERHNLQKAFSCALGYPVDIEEILEKARSGIYKDTPENRKLGRVGQHYGSKKVEEKKTSSEKEKLWAVMQNPNAPEEILKIGAKDKDPVTYTKAKEIAMLDETQ